MSDFWNPTDEERFPREGRRSWSADSGGGGRNFPPEGAYGPYGPPLQPEVIVTETVPRPPEPSRARWLVPLVLFVLTCLSTFAVADGFKNPLTGLKYSVCVLAVLLSHEMGHFLQAVRYGAPATLPFFLPMPFSPIGTFGAVIAMDTRRLDRRALFDIGISGPLAGLVPALVFTVVGIQQSQVVPTARSGPFMELGEPLLFTYLTHWLKGPLPEGYTLLLGPVAFAGWVGMLITALNLIPIGQLDGGHILYALLGRRANAVGMFFLLAAFAAVVIFGYWAWLLMIFLLGLLGPEHPPTANDDAPLGLFRVILGWLVLGFIIVGFTPEPFKM